jgi:hypothetical protein
MADEFKIEKGVPLPLPRRPRRLAKYPFANLQVGDSFLVPGFSKNGQISGSLANWAKAHPEWRFATRKVEGGLRVWRIEDRPALKDAAE